MTTQTIEKTARIWSDEPRKALGKPAAVKARSHCTQATMQAATFS
jgi:hypothetical protein